MRGEVGGNPTTQLKYRNVTAAAVAADPSLDWFLRVSCLLDADEANSLNFLRHRRCNVICRPVCGPDRVLGTLRACVCVFGQ